MAQRLATSLDELVVESAVAADDGGVHNAACHLLMTRLSPLLLGLHEELERAVADARLVVRTGEATLYANVILRCGVPF